MRLGTRTSCISSLGAATEGPGKPRLSATSTGRQTRSRSTSLRWRAARRSITTRSSTTSRRLRHYGMDEIADRTVVMAGRLFQIDRFLHNQDITWLSLKYTDGSPWLEFDCWVHLKGRFEFAIWRRTGDIY